MLVGVSNVPSPFPKSIETLEEPWLASARSKSPSSLKSPTATERGVVPTGRLFAGSNVPGYQFLRVWKHHWN